MTLQIGVIGVGMIGQDHIRRLTTILAGASIIAVSDVDAKQVVEVATRIGAKTYATGEELIASTDVEAVIVASWGPTHGRYVLACIAAGKPCFCEKPLAEPLRIARRCSMPRRSTVSASSSLASCAGSTLNTTRRTMH
jgi:myo-inositol 2-dehydrogenase/D-chiro-inositol 1-dehydrogenase